MLLRQRAQRQQAPNRVVEIGRSDLAAADAHEPAPNLGPAIASVANRSTALRQPGPQPPPPASPCSSAAVLPRRAMAPCFVAPLPPPSRRRSVRACPPERGRAPHPARASRASLDRPSPPDRPLSAPASPALLDPRVQRARPTHGYEDVLDCVLKVFCTHCEPNYELPWAMTAQRQTTSSAFVIEGRRILTNAHSVEHYTSVMVKKRYSDTKYPARVIAIGNECDIAQLEVQSEEFWDEFEHHVGLDDGRHPFLMPGPLPELQDPVLVIGYPSPGNQISVTAGVSSRVEMQHYVHGQGELLAVQIDAAVSVREASPASQCDL